MFGFGSCGGDTSRGYKKDTRERGGSEVNKPRLRSSLIGPQREVHDDVIGLSLSLELYPPAPFHPPTSMCSKKINEDREMKERK